MAILRIETMVSPTRRERERDDPLSSSREDPLPAEDSEKSADGKSARGGRGGEGGKTRNKETALRNER